MNTTIKAPKKPLFSALFACYYIALMPFIATFFKLLTSSQNEPSSIGTLNGQFYILVIVIPLIFLGADLYPIIISKKKLSPTSHIKNYTELYLLAGFLFWALISSLIQVVFLGNSTVFETLSLPYHISEGFPFFVYYAICLIMAFSIKDKQTAKNILFIVISSSVLLGICSIFDTNTTYLGNNRTTTHWAGLFLNSNHYGYFLTLCTMASSTLFCIARKTWLKIFAGFATTILMIVMMFNNTFGSLLSVFITLILLGVVLSIIKKKFNIKYFVPLIIFVISSLICIPFAERLNSLYSSFWSELYNLFCDFFAIADNPTSTQAKQAGTDRWALWLEAFSQIGKSPIIGSGDIYLRPHNEYLQFAAVWGLPCALLYIAAFVIIMIKSIKHLGKLSGFTLVCLFAVVGYLFSALFGNTMPHTTPYFMLFLGFLIRFLNEDIKSNKQTQTPTL